MKKYYENEREGQIDFFDNFRIDYKNNPVLIDNTDGIVNGNILEFKLTINNLNKVLFQAIKYLSRMRIKGESVPANILLVSLNTTSVYIYKSEDYFDEIHTVYSGAASKYNDRFVAKPYLAVYDYSNIEDTISLKNILKTQQYLPIKVDENCIVGWAERFYREHPKASKGDFIGTDEGLVPIVGEIRQPYFFKGLIQPYQGKSNEKFKYLMDKLNDNLNKKDLGAFYTPIPYCKKAAELVRKAIEKVPEGNDYIILDRCAGTGNLESVLTDEELSHCILSTYEYYEYKVLCERLGDKVRFIIPPTENLIEYSQGFVLNADAMSKEYIENPSIKEYIDDEKCTIILFENPPYRDITAKDKIGIRTKSYIYEQFKLNGTDQSSHREIANLFIWSAFKYYLRQKTDSYIVFSPVKYFKSLNIINKKFIEGYCFNRKYFHASPSTISCVFWSNEDEFDRDEYLLKIYDVKDDDLIYIKNIIVKKVKKTLGKYNDKRIFEDDQESDVFVDYTNGMQSFKFTNKKSLYNDNIIGYLRATSFNLNSNSRCLTRTITYDALTQSYGFYLRKDIYLEKLPLFVAKLFPQDNWYEKDIYFTTSDGGYTYIRDKDFIKSCLIYTCLSEMNKCTSFIGTDGRKYLNELCFDKDSVAFKDLSKMQLNKDENELLSLYFNILAQAKLTKNYKRDFRYGIYQIEQELNTFFKDENNSKIYDYPIMNGDLIALKYKLKDYYKKYIITKLFEYELIK